VNGKEVKKKFRKDRIKIDGACRKYSNEKNILQMREMVFVAPAPQEIKVMA